MASTEQTAALDLIFETLSCLMDKQEQMMQRLVALEAKQSVVAGFRKKYGGEHLKSTIPAVDKVFGTVELLENILGFLEVPDLLKAYQVHKTFYTTLKNSALLQKKLFLEPDSDSELAVLELKSEMLPLMLHKMPHGGVPITAEGESNDISYDEPKVEASYSIKAPWRAGDRIRRMFLTQPPITTMKLGVSCCEFGREGRKTCKSETGLTVGDILCAVKDLICDIGECTYHDEWADPRMFGISLRQVKDSSPSQPCA